MNFNITSFALPQCRSGEVRFEQPRDIIRVAVKFNKTAPAKISLFYLQNRWPEKRFELSRDLDNPCGFGWLATDDWFNTKWQKAAINIKKQKRTVEITFKGLRYEFPGSRDYDVAFRRTLGIKIETAASEQIKNIEVYTSSEKIKTNLRVELDSGRKTPTKTLKLTGYNAIISRISKIKNQPRVFNVTVEHMKPAHPFGTLRAVSRAEPRYSYDEGLITFHLNKDKFTTTPKKVSLFEARRKWDIENFPQESPVIQNGVWGFTVSLEALESEGPIWFAEQGVYVTRAEDLTNFADYRERIKNFKTVSERVLARSEQSFGGAFHGQPRPHPVSFNLGCKHNRHRFRLEPNGDLVLDKWNVDIVKGKDTPRFKNKGNARFFFGLERWCVNGRFPDPAPALAYNIHLQNGDVRLEQKSFAAPLNRSILDGEPASDETLVCLMRFRFHNTGPHKAVVKLPIQYSQDSSRSRSPLGNAAQDDNLIPICRRDTLKIDKTAITGEYNGKEVLRCVYRSTMKTSVEGNRVILSRELMPDSSCEAILKIPYVAVDSKKEVTALNRLDFEKCYEEVKKFWQAEGTQGAQLKTPEPHLNALYTAHLAHVAITDFTMPDDPHLINTGVGTSTYGNFSNESCMVIQELDQRGWHEEARRRLELWIKYQGTAPQPGNFTDYEGMYYGAGGWECGDYNQHHGWVLWCLAEHYFMTRDKEWFDKVSGSVIKACDWIFRQRRNTMKELPHSRGWEYGLLPAGSLEDVTDFWYWLSTNVLTWRGAKRAALALESVNHPAAGRVCRETNNYRRDIIKSWEIMRQYTPLVRLGNGRWVPDYSSRLYCRGRDFGWIREVLEGSVYLLISGLYDAKSRPARWILDDYQDNRYLKPPYGYRIIDPQINWYDRGGFSMQPNLLAGLMPYLERDEIEIYLWMFFNAWAACYRQEINAMVEHPMPDLGYSNSAHFKTSDQANAVMWLRYMYVYATDDALYLGRAIPREWLKDGNEIYAEKVHTYFGEVSVRYKSEADRGKITAKVNLSLERNPGEIIIRFRHPAKKPIKSVLLNGKKYHCFNVRKEEVDMTGMHGRLIITTKY